ncbi:MAG TPA: hypothetical protein V6D18_19240 [Thermosynechococcaceae cyanobacterium]
MKTRRWVVIAIVGQALINVANAVNWALDAHWKERTAILLEELSKLLT